MANRIGTTETSTQALIDEANRAAGILEEVDQKLFQNTIPRRSGPTTALSHALLFRLLAAELARLSTPAEGSNGEDVASDGPVADAGPHSPAPSPTRGGAIGETVPIREAVARVIYPRFSRSPTSLSADNQAISALRKADAILALISPPSSTNRAGAGE